MCMKYVNAQKLVCYDNLNLCNINESFKLQNFLNDYVIRYIFSGVYLVYITFRKLDPFPSSGVEEKGS